MTPYLHEAASARLLCDISKCVQANELGLSLLTQVLQRSLNEGPALSIERVDVDLKQATVHIQLVQYRVTAA